MNELQEQVVDVIEGLVASGAENGVQATVYRHGELIVDAVAGVADHRTGRPVTSDTLFYAASTVKGVTSTVVHVLVEQGCCPTTRWWLRRGRSSGLMARSRRRCGRC